MLKTFVEGVVQIYLNFSLTLHRCKFFVDFFSLRRPWYKTTSKAPHQISISTPYMDAAGVGKINTISQAVFEGMKVKSEEECRNFSQTGPWPGGCKCNVDDDCIISK